LTSFFTRDGDEGFSGLLGKGRIPKFDLRFEGIGDIDEANSALGLARALCVNPETKAVLLQVQRDLYQVMAEAAAPAENAEKFHVIEERHIAWLENQTETCGAGMAIPDEFIVPGDTLSAAALDLARTVVRRAERRLAQLLQRGDIQNGDLLRYLNRLSSLLFVLELRENQEAGKQNPTLAKMEQNDRNTD
jgi:cob(I)alamin adenosyltransferase